MNPSDLSSAWKQLNDILGIPFVQISLPLVIGAIVLLFKKVRDPVLRRVKAAWTAARQRVGKLAQGGHQRFLAACRSLGLVTRDDLAPLTSAADLAALENRLKAAISAAVMRARRPGNGQTPWSASA